MFLKIQDPNQPIPRITEGEDPFDDQSAVAEYLAPEPPDNSKFIAEVLSLLSEKGILEEEVFYKFGKSVESLSAIECLEAKSYIARLVVETGNSPFSPGDKVRVSDPKSRFYRFSGLVRGISPDGSRLDIYKLARGLTDAHGKAWEKGESFAAEQLELMKSARDIVQSLKRRGV